MRILRDQILDIIKDLSLRQTIELLANVMIAVAIRNFNSISDNQKVSSWDDFWVITQNDIKANGETLANALARQALTMNAWVVLSQEQIKNIIKRDELLEERKE